ncbi:cell division protein FtsN [Enterobacteriaceae bacterium LUAb1]
MAQKDYVSRVRSTEARRRKGNNQRNSNGISKMMIVLTAAVLVTFIGGLWFIVHHKKEESPVLPSHNTPGNGLPPKPEERWRYIKELENRQPGISTPTEPTAGGEIKGKTQLTDEQRQLLEQMQADMRQNPTLLNEVPWNEQTPVQRQKTLQQQSQLQQQSRIPQQLSEPKPPHLQQKQVAEQQPQIRQHTATIGVPGPETAVKPKPENTLSQRWIVQCGSFKKTDQAESVRAQLAFEGFESHITTNSGWNRVIIGPLNNRSSADSTLSRLRGSGHPGCILVAAGG